MTYFQGFLIPVKDTNKQAYLDLAIRTEPIFSDYGATRTVETWGEDVPHGKSTDYYRAVAAEDGESVVFSWIAWPDRATCDAAKDKLMTDERMQLPADLPFDGKRMIFGGFETVSDSDENAGESSAFGWIDGMVAPVATDKREAFLDHAAFMASKLKDQGATRVVNGWGVDVPDGQATDFKRAVQATNDETVVFGWIEWPDKATHDTGWGALMAEGIMQQNPPVWDGPRAIFGGFAPILDTCKA